MLPIIGLAVGGIIDIVKGWIGNAQEKQKAIHEADLAIIKGKQLLAEGTQSHNSAWELEALRTTSNPLRWVVSATVLAPIWWTMWSPEQGKAIFTTLETTVPQQWWALFLILCSFVFASKQLIELIKSVKFFK